MKSICVFCGSSVGSLDIYSQVARELGQLMAKQGISLIYGGGNIGLMGVIADEVLAGDGHVEGVIPDFLMAKELGHSGIQKMHVVASMHERKIKLAELADAFIVLPGGYGTLDELFEVMTWNQLGLIKKPLGILNTNGFWDPLISMLDRMTAQRFVRTEHRDSIVIADHANEMLQKLSAFEIPNVDGKWIDDLKSSSRY
jgi:uncharacterized protein (TIGR00730 family)